MSGVKRRFPVLIVIAIGMATAVLARAADAPATSPSTAPTGAWAFHGGGPMLGRAPDLAAPPMKPRWT
jgi:hypothetical protein